MKKLLLLSDEWNNDKNFVGSELLLIKQHFDVTVVCNDSLKNKDIAYTRGIDFKFYVRQRHIIKTLIALIKCIFDKDTLKEIGCILKEDNKISKISEVIRFYINAELFWDYIKNKTGVLPEDKDNELVVYSYWYFYKCFAFTKHRNEYPNMKILTRTHEYDLFTISIPSGYQPYKYAMDKQLDRIVFIAEQGRKYYLDKYVNGKRYVRENDSAYNNTINDKYVLYHLGTKDYNALNPYKKQDKFVLVSCSSVIPRKRVNLIIDALSTIKDIRIHWVHFGDGEQFEELKMLAEVKLAYRNDRINKENTITYELRGYTKHDEIMAFYQNNSVDAFAMVAISEGNPVSVMEAMSFGIPIISYDICNMKNVIKGNGILVPESSTAEELAKAICAMANADERVIEEYRKKSYEIWHQDYQEDVNNEKFLNEVLLSI